MEGLWKCLLLVWCVFLVYGFSLFLVVVVVVVLGWVGVSFFLGVSVVWFLFSSVSFLVLFFGWELLKVLLEVLYFLLVVKWLYLDEDDILVESLVVMFVSVCVFCVWLFYGFVFFLVKEEVCKVKRLYGMLWV